MKRIWPPSWPSLATGNDPITHTAPDITWAISDAPFYTLNNAAGARLTAETAANTIKAIIQECDTKQVPLMWWSSPLTTPDNLHQILLDHSFMAVGTIPGMALDLQTLVPPPPQPDSFEITRATSPEDGQQVGNISTQALSCQIRAKRPP